MLVQQSNTHTNDKGHRPRSIMKETRLFKVALPIFIELLFLTIYGTVDTLMLSNYSKEAVGAVGIANTLFMLFAILINIVALGIGSVASQYVGNNQLQKAKDTIKTGTYATICISTILFIALFFLRMPLLRLIGTDASLFNDAERYLKWASGDTFVILVGGVSIMFALNVGLGFVFTYVLEFGLMGILLAASLDETGRALFNMRRFKSKRWMHMKLIEHIQT